MKFAITTMAPAHKVGVTHIDPATVKVTPIEQIRHDRSNFSTVPMFNEELIVVSRRRHEDITKLR